MANQPNNGAGLGWIVAGVLLIALIVSNSGSTSSSFEPSSNYAASALPSPEVTPAPGTYNDDADLGGSELTFEDVRQEVAALPREDSPAADQADSVDYVSHEGDRSVGPSRDPAAPSSVGSARASSSSYAEPTLAPAAPSYASETGAARMGCGENGSCYGDISAATGRPRTVYVRGYTRRDGTYVRSHYRSRPRR